MDDCRKNDRRGMTGGIIVLGIGLFFLGVNYDYLPPVEDSWPLILVVVGLALIINNIFRKDSRDPEEDGPSRSGQ